MCGIWFFASLLDSPEAPRCTAITRIKRRGPDGVVEKHWVLQIGPHLWLHMRLVSSVLHMQGDKMSSQPVALHATAEPSSEPTAYLSWNGELYDIASTSGGVSDTAYVASCVSRALASPCPASALGSAMGQWQGPWSALIVDMAARRIWFARDCVGRRSLLLSRGQGSLCLSSVADQADTPSPARSDAAEVDPGVLFSIELASLTLQDGLSFRTTPVPRPLSALYGAFPAVDWAANNASAPAGQAADAGAVALLHALSRAVKLRVCSAARGRGPSPLPELPPPSAQRYCGVRCDMHTLPNSECSSAAPAHIAVMFSGGIDCMLLAVLAHRHVPGGEPIDLINVAFAQKETAEPIMQVQSPDRQAALVGLEELRGACPGRHWRLIQVNEDLASLRQHQEDIVALNYPRDSTMDFSIAAALWCGARGVGWVYGDASPQPSAELPPCTSAADSSAEQLVYKPMDNHPKTVDELCCLFELEASSGFPADCPGLASSGGTAAADFASTTPAGEQHSNQGSAGPVLVRSAARVVLLGMGADEQCGGYGRHLTAFLKGQEKVKGSGERGEPGWAALGAEMDMDVARIWQRNLGRDDRVVSDHGREARFPFLDEGVMQLLSSLPLPLVTDPRLPRGRGDKRIIRRAGDLLGLKTSSLLVKRAIQFGSRVARVTNKAVVAAAAAASGGDASAVSGRSAMKHTRGSDVFGGLPEAQE